MVLTKWESRPYFTAVWVWDNSASAYVNNTLEAHSKNGTAFSIFADANDYLTFMLPRGETFTVHSSDDVAEIVVKAEIIIALQVGTLPEEITKPEIRFSGE